MFGLSVPQPVLTAHDNRQPDAYWGARAIFKPDASHPIDLLHDRQSAYPEGIEKPRLLTWVNKTALPWLKKECWKLDPCDSKVLEFTEDDLTLMACPNSSYGYLYIGAWRYDGADFQYELAAPPPTTVVGAKAPFKGDGPFYSGDFLPARGDKVRINFNGLGTGRVLDFFREYRFIGLRILLDKQPAWHKKQNGADNPALVFGSEVEAIASTEKKGRKAPQKGA